MRQLRLNIINGRFLAYAGIGLIVTVLSCLSKSIQVANASLIVEYVLLIIAWIKCTRRLSSPFFIFLMYTFFSNAGQLLLIVFNIQSTFLDNVILSASEEVLIKAVWYQAISIFLMVSTAIIATGNKGFEDSGAINEIDALSETKRKGLNIGISEIVFIVFAIATIVSTMTGLRQRSSLGYYNYYIQEERSSLSTVALYGFYVSYFVNIAKSLKRNDKNKYFELPIGVLVAIIIMLLGSRNTMITFAVGTLFLMNLYSKHSKRLKIGNAIVITVLGLLFMGGFKQIRNIPLNALSIGDILNVFGTGIVQILFDIIGEMGASLKVLLYTISAVDGGNVSSQQTFLYTVLKSIIPVGFLNLVGITEPTNWSLSSWVSTTYNFGGSGLGYSFLAETYFNFREFGILFSIPFAYFYVWLENKIRFLFNNGKTVVACSWLYVASYMVFLARADSALISTVTRYSLYITVLIYLTRKLKIKI